MLPFLDVRICKTDNKVHTSVYRKVSNNDVVLHFSALAPKSYKVSVIRSFIYRAFYSLLQLGTLSRRV